MKLILKDNLFHVNGKHFLQTHSIAMGTKMAVAFSVIFMAHVEKQLLLSSPHKPIISKGSLMTFSQCGLRANKKSAIFVANRFHATIKFTSEMSSERAVLQNT